MGRLVVFNSTSVDGYFTDEKNDIRWAKQDDDAEFHAYVEENATGGGVLLFGRITYEMMASYWPTPAAAKADPVVAKQMNALNKIVFSRTLQKASWSNTKLIKDGMAAAVRDMKKGPEDMAILGSGSIVAQLTSEGLIDEYQLVVNPIALGKGRTMFDGLKKHVPMKLTRTRPFRNGKVVLCYEPE